MNLKETIILLLLVFSACNVNAQPRLELTLAGYSGGLVLVQRFDAFKVLPPDTIRFDRSGVASWQSPRKELVLLSMADKTSWPVLLNRKTVSFKLDTTGKSPEFGPRDRDNPALYAWMTEKRRLRQMVGLAQHTMSRLSPGDRFVAELEPELNRLVKKQPPLPDPATRMAYRLLEARNLSDRSALVKNTEQAKTWKKELLDYMGKHYRELERSDLIMQIAYAWFMLDEMFIPEGENWEGLVRKDAARWVELSREHSHEQQAIRYIFDFYFNRGIYHVADSLLQAYPDRFSPPSAEFIYGDSIQHIPDLVCYDRYSGKARALSVRIVQHPTHTALLMLVDPSYTPGVLQAIRAAGMIRYNPGRGPLPVLVTTTPIPQAWKSDQVEPGFQAYTEPANIRGITWPRSPGGSPSYATLVLVDDQLKVIAVFGNYRDAAKRILLKRPDTNDLLKK